MTKEEFVKACARGGYCSAQEARKWLKRKSNVKTEYTETDMIEVYRNMNAWSGEHTGGMRAVYGTNGRSTAFRYGVGSYNNEY